MSFFRRSVLAVVLVASIAFSARSFAVPLIFTEVFPGGFDVSINGGPLGPSGPITIVGIVDSGTADIFSDPSFGEFPLTSLTFTGAGYVNRPVTNPMSLSTFAGGSNFCFQRLGEFNEGDTGWNGNTPSGPFMNDVNNLSTLVPLPYGTFGESTFWYNGLTTNLWTLAGGDTIGADLGAGGPDGKFSIIAIPEPSSMLLAFVASSGVISYRRRKAV